MSWDRNLLPEQRDAAIESNCHVCLLAGPGTGKTLTLSRHIIYLIQEENVEPSQILALTFTRAATHELRQRVSEEFDSETLPPRITTIHSFALSQLLRNTSATMLVPRPLRIADDWEERYIIKEDLKNILGSTIKEINEKFQQLSADWETLGADAISWEQNYPDARFLGAWRQHRQIYGYMLRSELVYQLKKSMEQDPNFTLDQSYRHVVVDEYQDLNKCDLAVVKAITSARGKLFASGDDDQSIYGFRFAYPQGIRAFRDDYDSCKIKNLTYCLRCDNDILTLALFVANLDPRRIGKRLDPMPSAKKGEVHVLNFDKQDREALGVAKICKHLIQNNNVKPADILILIRTDHYGAFSSVLRAALIETGIPVSSKAEDSNPTEEPDGRVFLSVLRLCINQNDHLAWRTLLQIRGKGIGDKTLLSIYDLALRRGLMFTQALHVLKESPDSLVRSSDKIIAELESINKIINDSNARSLTSEQLPDFFDQVAKEIIFDDDKREIITAYFKQVLEDTDARNLAELLSIMSTSLGDKEQEIDNENINILTMHKAKGLTAEAVFIVGAEDEYLPGDEVEEEKVGDERRLLYVSLTRAKHFLYITYCKERTGPQKYTGSTSGKTRRNLTRFLIDAPIKPRNGETYCNSLITA